MSQGNQSKPQFTHWDILSKVTQMSLHYQGVLITEMKTLESTPDLSSA
jgi:hypothetical protein